MGTKASKTHEITIKARFDAPLTRRQARYAVWNAIADYTLYGDGKPTARERRDGDIGAEPFGTGKIMVRR
jgi:hypothetical protein